MTKETKIGLLVGLAFIILFAIILSEKGAAPQNAAMPQFTQAPIATDRLTSGARPGETPLSKDGRIAVEHVLPTPPAGDTGQTIARHATPPSHDPKPTELAAGPPSPAESDDAAGLPTLDTNLLDQVGDRPPVKTSEQVADRGAGEPEPPPPSSGVIPPALPAESTRESTDRTIETAIADAATARRESRLTPNDQAATHSPLRSVSEPTSTRKTARPGSIAYTVQPGDTISKIAAKIYGSSSEAFIRRIMAENTTTLRDRNVLKVGQTLTLPPITDLLQDASGLETRVASADTAQQTRGASRGTPSIERAAVDTGRPDAAKTSPTTSANLAEQLTRAAVASDAGKYRWYVVRPKDTLSRIARQQMGDARRYRELYELNRGIVSDLNRLKPGMRIRVPVGPRGNDRRSGDSAATPRGATEVASR